MGALPSPTHARTRPGTDTPLEFPAEMKRQAPQTLTHQHSGALAERKGLSRTRGGTSRRADSVFCTGCWNRIVLCCWTSQAADGLRVPSARYSQAFGNGEAWPPASGTENSVCTLFFAFPIDTGRELEAYSKSRKNSDCRSAIRWPHSPAVQLFPGRGKAKMEKREGHCIVYFITDTCSCFFGWYN